MIDKAFFHETFSAVHASEETLTEVLKMSEKTKEKRSGRKFLRVALVAAALMCLMVTTALAYIGFSSVMDAFFGVNGYESRQVNEYYSFERVPVDEELAEKYINPYLTEIASSVTIDDTTLTVEYHMYDSVTGSGLVYYTLENPNGVNDYLLQENGEVWWPGEVGEMFVNVHPYGTGYIDVANTTDTKLFVALHYANSRDRDTVQLDLIQRGEMGTRLSQETIAFPIDTGVNPGGITLADGDIRVSATGMFMDASNMDWTIVPVEEGGRGYPHPEYIREVTLRFANGEEYVVDGEGTLDNTARGSMTETTLTLAFNRIVDYENITEVILNGHSYPVD